METSAQVVINHYHVPSPTKSRAVANPAPMRRPHRIWCKSPGKRENLIHSPSNYRASHLEQVDRLQSTGLWEATANRELDDNERPN